MSAIKNILIKHAQHLLRVISASLTPKQLYSINKRIRIINMLEIYICKRIILMVWIFVLKVQ